MNPEEILRFTQDDRRGDLEALVQPIISIL
jgi:hypothetical protein